MTDKQLELLHSLAEGARDLTASLMEIRQTANSIGADKQLRPIIWYVTKASGYLDAAIERTKQ